MLESDKTVPVCTLTFFVILLILMYLDVPGVKLVVMGVYYILSVIFGLFFLVGLLRPVMRRIQSVIFWIGSKISNVYSFFNSEVSDVCEYLTPVHQVTVSSPVLFLVENLKPTITPQAVFRVLTRKNDFDGKEFLQIVIPVDAKQPNIGTTGKALVSIPREHLIASGILQMCNPSSSLSDNWTVQKVNSRQLLQFKNIKSWRVKGKADQVTSCPLLKEIKTQFGYSVIDCGCSLFDCKDFKQKYQIFVHKLASKGVLRLVIKADTLQKSKAALEFCRDSKYSHFIYVEAGFDLDLKNKNSEVRACLKYVKQIRSHKGFACIGGVPLGYHAGKLTGTKEKQLQDFKEIVPFCYNQKIPIHFHVGPNQSIHRDFLDALRYYQLMIYSYCVSLNENGIYTEEDIATLVKDFGCFIMIEGDNLKYNSRVASLIKNKIIPVEKIILQSNAPHSFIGETKKEAWHNMKDFQVNFCQKQLRYLHPESLQNMYNEDGGSVPTILHCVIELLAGIVDIPPLSLAKTLIENTELFYKFSDPS
ncbi:uncharacterized protein LOC133181435 [Saccostrea echinata]|uniref:uncharacterized protein LOC133181435 n=1 Tax=Saccostrea echinata TaxID=191078 RepID=UPI002A800882|nr:uncharacterized protein LOC133181435 [Saccostrea echinata]